MNQVVAGVHVYDFRPCGDPRLLDEELGPRARAAPVVAGELGQKACASAFIDRFMDWADRAGVYLGWTWNPTGT